MSINADPMSLQIPNREPQFEASNSGVEESSSLLVDWWQLSPNAKIFVAKAAIIASTGGLLFGYDIGVIEGALPKLEEEMRLSLAQQDTVVSTMIAGAIVGHQDFSDTAFFAPGVMRRIGATEVVDCIAFGDQVKRLMLCALEVFLRRSGGPGGDADHRSPLAEPSELADLTRVLLGTDLAGMFPQARVERVCSGGILPSRDFVSGASLS